MTIAVIIVVAIVVLFVASAFSEEGIIGWLGDWVEGPIIILVPILLVVAGIFFLTDLV